jgi:FMN phosphatase YigB (HAD superfamily)
MIQTPSIEVVSFDFWNTLASPNSMYFFHRTEILRKYSNITDPDKIKMMFKSYKTELDHNAEKYGKALSCLECFSNLHNVLNLGAGNRNASTTKKTVRNLMREMQELALKYPPVITTETQSMISQLRKKGYGLCITSNTNFISGKTLTVWMRYLGMEFDSMTFSDEFLYSKPSSEIFNHTVRQMDTFPSNTLHVGDNEICDILGAKNCGIQTLFVENPSDAVQKINQTLLA